MSPKSFLTPLLLGAAAASLGACAYNETLGRNQFLIVDDSALIQQSRAAWAETLRTQKVSNNAAQTIQATADGISDPNLRAALERLASHARPRD